MEDCFATEFACVLNFVLLSFYNNVKHHLCEGSLEQRFVATVRLARTISPRVAIIIDTNGMNRRVTIVPIDSDEE